MTDAHVIMGRSTGEEDHVEWLVGVYLSVNNAMTANELLRMRMNRAITAYHAWLHGPDNESMAELDRTRNALLALDPNAAVGRLTDDLNYWMVTTAMKDLDGDDAKVQQLPFPQVPRGKRDIRV